MCNIILSKRWLVGIAVGLLNVTLLIHDCFTSKLKGSSSVTITKERPEYTVRYSYKSSLAVRFGSILHITLTPKLL
jgi:hypothetical protein